VTNTSASLRDPERDLSDELELEVVRYIKARAATGQERVLEHTLTDIHDALKENKMTYSKAQVGIALALLSDRKRGILNKRVKGAAAFYSLQCILDLCHDEWDH